MGKSTNKHHKPWSKTPQWKIEGIKSALLSGGVLKKRELARKFSISKKNCTKNF